MTLSSHDIINGYTVVIRMIIIFDCKSKLSQCDFSSMTNDSKSKILTDLDDNSLVCASYVVVGPLTDSYVAVVPDFVVKYLLCDVW